MEKRYIHWEFLVSALIIVASNLGITLFFAHLDNKTKARSAAHQKEQRRDAIPWL